MPRAAASGSNNRAATSPRRLTGSPSTEGGGGGDTSPSDLYRPEILVMDNERSNNNNNNESTIGSERRSEANTNAARRVLDFCGDLLDQADNTLNGDDFDDSMLASAIQRGCEDLADAVSELATELEQQSDEDRQALAQACIQDVQAAAQAQKEQQQLVQQILALGGEDDDDNDNNDNLNTRRLAVESSFDSSVVEWHEFATTMDENQLVQVMVAAGSFLRDVEASLRTVDQNEANELADVALTVARIFIASLQSMHAQLSPEDLTDYAAAAAVANGGGGFGGTTTRAAPSTVRIELLDEHEEDDDDDGIKEKAATSNNQSRGGVGSNSSSSSSKNKKKTKHRKQMDRLRVLWPPLGPAVAKALNWGKDAASQQPLLAIALGMTLWPAAVATAFVGTPVVLVDGFLQDMYANFHDVPLVVGLERGAAQVFHTGRLALVSGKVVGRHSLGILHRQVDRNGGVGHICAGVAGMALDRALHPLETMGMVCHSIGWSVDQIRRFVEEHVVHKEEHQDQERTLQDLQQ